MQPQEDETVWFFRRSPCLVGRQVVAGVEHLKVYDVSEKPPYPEKVQLTTAVPLEAQYRDLGRALAPGEVVLSAEVTLPLLDELVKRGFIIKTQLRVVVDGDSLVVARLAPGLKTVSAQGVGV